MPLNLATGGSTYFAAARQLAMLSHAGTARKPGAIDPYFQQVFSALNGVDLGFGAGPATATQNVYQLFQQNLYNETYALYELDVPDSLSGAGVNPNQTYPSYRFYHDQYSALYSWRSIGNSNYHALEVVYRQRIGAGSSRHQLHVFEVDGYHFAVRAVEYLGRHQLLADPEYLESQSAVWCLRLRRPPPDQFQLHLESARRPG